MNEVIAPSFGNTENWIVLHQVVCIALFFTILFLASSIYFNYCLLSIQAKLRRVLLLFFGVFLLIGGVLRTFQVTNQSHDVDQLIMSTFLNGLSNDSPWEVEEIISKKEWDSNIATIELVTLKLNTTKERIAFEHLATTQGDSIFPHLKIGDQVRLIPKSDSDWPDEENLSLVDYRDLFKAEKLRPTTSIERNG